MIWIIVYLVGLVLSYIVMVHKKKRFFRYKTMRRIHNIRA